MYLEGTSTDSIVIQNARKWCSGFLWKVFSPGLFPQRILFLFSTQASVLVLSSGACAGPRRVAFTVSSSWARFGLSLPGSGDCEWRSLPPATSWNCGCCRGCCGDASWCSSSGNLTLPEKRDLPVSADGRSESLVKVRSACYTYELGRWSWGGPSVRSHGNE